VFTRSGTIWTEQAKLLASDGESDDYFGRSVSLNEDIILIGAKGDDTNGEDSGSAYVFTRLGTNWTEQAKLLASDGDPGDLFGVSVSILEDKILIGAPGDDDNGEDSGSAYIFTGSGTSWTQDCKLLSSDGATGDRFGSSVSISKNLALIGAYGDDDYGLWSGSAYIFSKLIPDLECIGSLSWIDILPGEIVTGFFEVVNVGEPISELDWEIESPPNWGTWTFVPSSGTGLTPEMGTLTVAVEVVAPNEVNTEFTGDIKVVNSEDSTDFDLVPVLLKTPRDKAFNKPILNWLQSHPNLFPLLQKLIQQLGL
jgi:hypothetical protein